MSLIRYLVRKYFQRIRKFVYRTLSNNTYKGSRPYMRQPVCFEGKGTIVFGNNVTLGNYPSPNFYDGAIYLEAREKESIIRFGNNIYSNNNLSIIAENGEISLGDNVLIGTNVEIINSDFHHIHPEKRNSGLHKSKNVIIESNVFIGSNVKILKGVTIGRNSIISNGSVVFDSMPENSIIKGNPAVVYMKIDT